MLRYCFCPYIYGHLQGRLPRQGQRGPTILALIVTTLSAIWQFLQKSVHARLKSYFLAVSSKISPGGFLSWRKKQGASSSEPEALPRVENFVRKPGQKVKPSWISPKTPSPQKWVEFSNLDRVVNPTFSSVILFYDGNSLKQRTYDDVEGKLKKSLAKVLSAFYPLAGELELRDNGLVDLHCTDKGLIFLEEYMDKELSAFGRLGPMPGLSGLDHQFTRRYIGEGPRYLPDQIQPIPVCIIQLTRFKCHSMALAVNWHHTVADGSSGCHFLKAWAEVSSGGQISVHPIHDRNMEQLRPRNPLNHLLVNRGGYSTKMLATEEVDRQHAALKPTVIEALGISREAVDELKRRANEAFWTQSGFVEEKGSNGNGLVRNDASFRGFTSVESFSGALWKASTKARYRDGAQMSKEEVTRFFMFVDGRKRLGLPAGYFGNVVCSACAVAKEKELIDSDSSYASSLIRDSTRGITGEYFRSLIDWVQAHSLNGIKSEHVNSLGHDVAATFWVNFPIYKMDFGWGKPMFGARNSPPRDLIDGFSVMPSNKGEKDWVCLMNMSGDRLERLKADEETLAFDQ